MTNSDTSKINGHINTKRADEVVKMIADDFLLKTGTLENTGYRISRTEDNETLFDIIQNALDITVMNTKELYVFV